MIKHVVYINMSMNNGAPGIQVSVAMCGLGAHFREISPLLGVLKARTSGATSTVVTGSDASAKRDHRGF